MVGVVLFNSNTSTEHLSILNLSMIIECKGLMFKESKFNFFDAFLCVFDLGKLFKLNTLISGFLIINLLMSIILFL